jgi:phosphotriesterase-related protein
VARVNTFSGPVDSEQLGFTLMHEHFFMIDPGLRAEWPETFDRAEVVRRSVEALREARAAGVDTLVDLTTYDLGRDVRLTEEIVRQVDMQIIAATGMWLYPPRALQGRPPELVADLFVRDVQDGIQGTAIKAAIIKLASDDAQLAGPLELMFRAAARAHRQTGVPISTHTDTSQRSGLDQQRVLVEERVDLTRVIIGHSGDTEDLDYLERLLDRGSYLGLDRFGIDAVAGRPLPKLEQRVRVTAELCRRGYADRLVLSQDLVIMFDELPAERFAYISKKVIPALLEAGVTRAQVDQMTRRNPRAIFERTGAY